MSQLVTGEAVVLQVRIARMPTRSLAIAIDVILQLIVLGLLLATLLVFLIQDASPALAVAVVIFVVLLVMIGYPVLMETLTRGRTLGKMALGLRVVRDDGSSIRFRQAFVRALLWLFVDFAPWFACCPGIVASVMNKQGKRIGDMVAGTVVIRERHQSMPSPPLFVPGPLVQWAQSLELSRLGDDLANTSREYLARYTELEPAAREAIGNALAFRVGEVTAPAPPIRISAPAFLSAVLAERRRRELARLATQQSAYAPNPYGTTGPFAHPSPYGGQPGPYGGHAGPYGQPGTYGQPGPYGGQPGPYGGQPGPYGQPGTYGQPGPYGSQPGPHSGPASPYGAQPGTYGQPGPYGQPSPYGAQPGQYGQPAPNGGQPGSYGQPEPYRQPSQYGTQPGQDGGQARPYGTQPRQDGGQPDQDGTQAGPYGGQPGQDRTPPGRYGIQDDTQAGRYGTPPGQDGTQPRQDGAQPGRPDDRPAPDGVPEQPGARRQDDDSDPTTNADGWQAPGGPPNQWF
jgi:uncharacterized RDD family membrane protein YckC